jgi:hypothetical protein
MVQTKEKLREVKKELAKDTASSSLIKMHILKAKTMRVL